MTRGPVRIRPIFDHEIEAARTLLAANAWGPRVQDPTLFAELVRRSQVALVAVDGGEVIGFIRGLTDGIFNGYISMVVVAQAHRGRHGDRAPVDRQRDLGVGMDFGGAEIGLAFIAHGVSPVRQDRRAC